MNGDSMDPSPGGSPLKSTLSGCQPPNNSTFVNNSLRLKRLEEMKKSYLSTGGPPPSSGYTSTLSGYGSKYGGAPAGASYRLASLDRLAHRHKLYDANGTDSEVTVNGVSPPSTNGGPLPAGPDLPSPRDNGEHVQQSIPSFLGSAIPSSLSNGTLTSSSALQNKREMFFKSDSTGGSVTGGLPTPLTHPSTAPPAPPVPTTAPPASNAPHKVNGVATSDNHQQPSQTTIHKPFTATNHSTATATTTTTTGVVAATTTTPPGGVVATNLATPSASVASIKEQLLTTKEKDKKIEVVKEGETKEKIIVKRRPREVDGYVGFVNLPNQVYRKAVKKGFQFTLMVVGGSGLGKSTLMNSMFLTDIYSNEYPGPSHRVKKTVQVETTKTLLKENGVDLTLTVVDTPGFGDAVDNSDCWQPVIDYIDNKYEDYLTAESKVNRKQIADNRVHCCLYFIAPSGHGLRSLDVEFMRRLHDKVNIIPVIAKADSLTPEECQHLKKQILNEISQHKIKIYEFPDEDADGVTLKMKSRVPFAVVGSNVTLEVDGKKTRGRRYPWGTVEVENMEHCDFIPLRNMMIRTHMQDLKDVTNGVHYENFRCRKLAGVGGPDTKAKMTNKNPLTQLEDEKREHSARMKKLEGDMQQVFEMKVKEKMSKLNDLESDLQKRNETMRKKLESDFLELEEERERFAKEKRAWEAANNVTVEDLRRRSLESVSSRDGVDGKKKKKGLF